MSFQRVLKGVLVPAAAVVTVAKSGHSLGPHCQQTTECLCKPSDLPVYPSECTACQAKPPEIPASELEKAIGKIRKELWVWQDEIHGYRQRVIDVCTTGYSHTSSSLDFLRVESNVPERYGAIALASLAGFILGLRGGKFKRLTYATLGGVGMAALCYPREAAEYTDIALQQGNQYFTAGYLFAFGEKPKIPDWFNSILNNQKKETPKEK